MLYTDLGSIFFKEEKTQKAFFAADNTIAKFLASGFCSRRNLEERLGENLAIVLSAKKVFYFPFFLHYEINILNYFQMSIRKRNLFEGIGTNSIHLFL